MGIRGMVQNRTRLIETESEIKKFRRIVCVCAVHNMLGAWPFLNASDWARTSVDFIAWRLGLGPRVFDLWCVCKFIFRVDVTALPLTFQRSRYPVVQSIEQNEIILASRRLHGCNQRQKGNGIVGLFDCYVSFLDREVPKGEFFFFCMCVKENRQSNKMNRRQSTTTAAAHLNMEIELSKFHEANERFCEVLNHRQMSYIAIPSIFPFFSDGTVSKAE